MSFGSSPKKSKNGFFPPHNFYSKTSPGGRAARRPPRGEPPPTVTLKPSTSTSIGVNIYAIGDNRSADLGGIAISYGEFESGVSGNLQSNIAIYMSGLDGLITSNIPTFSSPVKAGTSSQLSGLITDIIGSPEFSVENTSNSLGHAAFNQLAQNELAIFSGEFSIGVGLSNRGDLEGC